MPEALNECVICYNYFDLRKDGNGYANVAKCRALYLLMIAHLFVYDILVYLFKIIAGMLPQVVPEETVVLFDLLVIL